MKTKTLLPILFAAATTSTQAMALTKEEIRQSVQQKGPQMQECYNDALKIKKSIGGKLVLSWEITDTGKAEKVKVVKSVEKNLDACITKLIAETPFTAAPQGTIAEIGSYTFDLKASDKTIKPE